MIKQTLSIAAGMCVVSLASALTPDEQAGMLAAHNQWRKEAGVPDVKWSSSLAATAQTWATKLQTQSCNMTHSGISGLGENLYWASPLMYSDGKKELQPVSPAKVTESWGSEKQDYDYASNTCAKDKVCGHYTQVVWKTTTEVGCAKAICGDFSQVWVCNYTPPGNWRGQKPY
jgi:pathogenesis-related protein 1